MLSSPSGKKFKFQCRTHVLRVLIDPILPPRFDDTKNEDRPDRHMALWGVPFIVSSEKGFTVRCLDGGAWDRSTWWGQADHILEAIRIARTGPAYYNAGGAK
jgi:hypothetical protein